MAACTFVEELADRDDDSEQKTKEAASQTEQQTIPRTCKDESVQTEHPTMKVACVQTEPMERYTQLVYDNLLLKSQLKNLKEENVIQSKKKKQCKEAASRPRKLLEDLANKQKIRRADEIAKFIKNRSPS
ncbi:unnamed protein product [Meloidogyne enterolobii]|uniref:Uncharacterized protein n=1 Tax=Meloidogyne enterolobii TaxID=390850 RepID=A0ACB0ZK04_MELEN